MGEKSEVFYLGEGPPLEVLDKLPTPEEVFKVPRIGRKELFLYCLGPAIIAMGGAIGSGEWLMGPVIAAKYGLGLFWLVWVGALLQAFYNSAFARITIATGEPPGVWMTRAPPRTFWLLFIPVILFISWAWPGWALGAATAVMTFIYGHLPTTPEEITMVKICGIILFFICLAIVSVGAKIERTLEIWSYFVVFGVTILLFIALGFALALSPYAGEAVSEFGRGLISVGYIPKGIDIFTFGGWWGYTGWATCLNWMLINYYRDKGYGMGHKVGYIPAIIGGRKVALSGTGKTFKPTKENVETFKRWTRLVAYDQWLIYFPFALLGMYLPALFVRALVPVGTELPKWGIAAHVAPEFAKLVGPWGLYFIAFIGAVVLFSTQVQVADTFMRNVTDIVWSGSETIREKCKGDVRYLYYGIFLAYIVFASCVIWFKAPLWYLLLMANMANFGAFYTIPLLWYFDRKMPEELRIPKWWWPFLIVFGAICAFIFIAMILGKVFGIVIF